MSQSAIAVAGFAAWTLALVMTLGIMRTHLVLGGKRRANNFKPDGSDVSAFSGRLCRAHANCYENLPIFASLVLVAMVTGRAEVTDPLALWFLAARIGQSVVHLISTSIAAVTVRFAFFLVQVGIMVWYAFALLTG